MAALAADYVSESTKEEMCTVLSERWTESLDY
jgi:hypothetical protein